MQEGWSKLSCLWQLRMPHHRRRRGAESRNAAHPSLIVPLRTLAVVKNLLQGDSQAGEQRSGQGIGGG